MYSANFKWFNICLLKRTTQINEDKQKQSLEVKERVNNYFSALRTRDPHVTPDIYDKFPKLRGAVPKLLEMDYSRILKKPYYLKEVSWTASSQPWVVISEIKIPTDLWVNSLAKIPFTASVYYRAKISMIMQVSGSPMHGGSLLIAAMPWGWYPINATPATGTIKEYNINSYLSAPHGFAYPSDGAPVVLPVPFYVQGHLAAIDLTQSTVSPFTIKDNYASVYVMPSSVLTVPANGSATVRATISVVFDELEFYVPHIDPEWITFTAQGYAEAATRFIDGIFSAGKRFTGDFIDSVRSTIREWTGLHAPECPAIAQRNAVQFRQNTNLVDTPSHYEKMDPFGQFVPMVDDYAFCTDVDEMEMSYILSKPQYVGSFKIATDQVAAGTLLFSRPITPIQQIIDASYKDANGVTQRSTGWSNLMQTFAYLSTFWKGSIKLHLQASMSHSQFCRLTIARDYSPDKNMLTKYPAFASVFNLMTETVEFSGGGQIQTITLPFCSPLDRLPCSFDFIFNALQHGMYYIYLNTPVTGQSSTYPIVFNVYISAGDDFQFYGYSLNPILTGLSTAPEPTFLANGEQVLDPIEEEISSQVDEIVSSNTEVVHNDMSELADIFTEAFNNKILKDSTLTQVESKFVAQANAMVSPSDQSDVLIDKSAPEPEFEHVLRPIKSVRDYARRMTTLKRFVFDKTYLDSTGGFMQIQVGTLLGLNPVYDLQTIASGFFLVEDLSPLALMSRLFMGYKGGIKLKVIINGTTLARAWYVPPQTTIDKDVQSWRGTQPVPPPASLLYDPLGELFQATINSAQAGYSTGYNGCRVANTVTVERPNYINNVTNNYNEYAEGKIISNDCCMFEFMIPYMSAYNFVGNSGSGCRTGYPGDLELACNDLGNLVIDLNQVYSRVLDGTNDKVVQNQISMDILGAITDEGRYGFQVTACPLVVPCYAVVTTTPAGTTYSQRLPQYNSSTEATPLARPKPNPGSLGTGCPACYVSVV